MGPALRTVAVAVLAATALVMTGLGAPVSRRSFDNGLNPTES